jgi:RHS repeat-associated protein
MNITVRLCVGAFWVLVFTVLAPSAALAKYIGADPPCPTCQACQACAQPAQSGGCNGGECGGFLTNGNASQQVPIARVSSTSGGGLDLALSYNTYNADGSRAQLDIGLGYGWSHSYSALLFNQAGHMFRYDGAGRVTRYQYVGANTYKTSAGYFETLVKKPDGSFAITYKDGTAYRYEKIPGDTLLVNGPVWRLARITDRNGNSTVLAYVAGRLSQVTDVYGRSLSFAYNGSGHLASVNDPLNRTTAFAYDGTGRRLTAVTDPLGKTLQFSYDTINQVVGKTDKDGRRFSFGYSNLEPVSTADGAGNPFYGLANPNNWATDDTVLAQTQTRQYLPGTVTKTDGRGNAWKYQYDLHGYIAKATALDGAATQYTYDPATLLRASMTDANGHTTAYTYDGQGNRLTETDALGHTTQYQYEPVYNNVIQITYPNGSVTQYQYDAHGNRTREIRDVGGLNIATVWTYYVPSVVGNPSPAAGLVKTQEVHNGADTQTTSYAYDAFGNQIQAIDPLGNTSRSQYDLVGNRTQMTDANGHVTVYAYDALNRLSQQTDPLGFKTLYRYDGMGDRVEMDRQVSKAPDAFEVTQYQYDLRRRLVREVRDPAGLNLATQIAYDGNDNRITLADPRLNLTQYAYDVQNRLSRVTDALANVTQTQYDGVGNRVCVIDANGHDTFYQYDALNRLSRETRKIGAQSCAPADGDDILTQTFYDTGAAIPSADCRSPQCAGPIPGSSSPAYRIDPEGKYTYFKYDHINRGVMTLRKVGDITDDFDHTGNPADDDWSQATQYDDVGNVLARYDANGHPTVYTYWLNNWLKTEANALAETTRYTYDSAGNVKTVTSPGGNITTHTYDDRDELVQVDDLIGRVASYAYDGIGNRTQQCDGNGNCARYQYDAVNRLVALADALAQTAHYSYDPDNNLIKILDRDGKAVCYVYDAINRRTRQVRKVGDTDCTVNGGDGDTDDMWAKTVYDGVGNIVELTTDKNGGTPSICNGASPTPNCETTRYAYDAVNRLVQEAYPLRFAGDPVKNTREFAYDRAGNLVRRVDQENRSTFYRYNDLYYLSARDYDTVTEPDDSFVYDVGGRMLQALRDDPAPLGVDWLDTFTYDAADRVLAATQNGQPVSYAYDIPNRKRSLIYPGGRVVVEQRDLRERLDTLNAGAIADYAYDLADRVTSRVYGNGTQAVYGYNANNWITGLNHTKSDISLIAGFGYAYDNEGNRRYEDKAHNPGHSEAYQYDDLYRLIHYKVGTLDMGGDVPVPLTQTQYELDKLGNWNDKTDTVGAGPGVTQARQHNAVNEITQVGAVSIASDPDGNLSQDERYFYVYDQENRLAQVTQIAPSEVAGQYHYDALGRRVAKITGPTRGNSEIRYFYDDARIVEEQDSGGATLATYAYGNYIDEVLAMERGGQTYYYHQNALWSVEAVTDGTQTVVERYSYDAYGMATVTNGAGIPVMANAWGAPHSAIGNPWLFTGRQLDEEGGLYYYRARYYDSGKGRFLQRDPLGYKGGANLYQYVRGNPINGIDPYGLKDICCLKNKDNWNPPTNFSGEQKTPISNEGIRVHASFNVEAEFIGGKKRGDDDCCCKCCEFRQEIKGVFKLNGTIVDHPLLPDEFLDENTFKEDGTPDGSRYGHRTDGNRPGDLYKTSASRGDRANGCFYRSFDDPGLAGFKTDSLEAKLTFRFRIIDTCPDNNDRVEAEKDWPLKLKYKG